VPQFYSGPYLPATKTTYFQEVKKFLRYSDSNFCNSEKNKKKLDKVYRTTLIAKLQDGKMTKRLDGNKGLCVKETNPDVSNRRPATQLGQGVQKPNIFLKKGELLCQKSLTDHQE